MSAALAVDACEGSLFWFSLQTKRMLSVSLVQQSMTASSKSSTWPLAGHLESENKLDEMWVSVVNGQHACLAEKR